MMIREKIEQIIKDAKNEDCPYDVNGKCRFDGQDTFENCCKCYTTAIINLILENYKPAPDGMYGVHGASCRIQRQKDIDYLKELLR